VKVPALWLRRIFLVAVIALAAKMLFTTRRRSVSLFLFNNTRPVLNAARSVLIASFFCLSFGNAFAQSSDGKEPAAVVEVGGSASQSVTGDGSSFGPTVAVEVTPIENRLELEAGVTSLFKRHSTEWDVDLLFKKPWTLSKKAEFMVGIAPEWVRTTKYGVPTNSVSGEAVADFMFWPSAKHRFGWYLEPSYDYSFGRGHEQSLGVNGGLLIAIP
jgi:hypothetical protein